MTPNSYKEHVLRSQAEPKTVLLMFHGYNSDMNDLLQLGRYFAHILKDTEVRIPNGFSRASMGYQWFDINTPQDQWKDNLIQQEEVLKQYVKDVTVNRHGVESVILCGFSQGAMVSMHIGLQLDVDAIVAFSGMLLDKRVAKKAQKSKIFIAHGARDDVLPVQHFHDANEFLKQKFHVTTCLSEHMDHGINEEMIDKVTDFLQKIVH